MSQLPPERHSVSDVRAGLRGDYAPFLTTHYLIPEIKWTTIPSKAKIANQDPIHFRRPRPVEFSISGHVSTHDIRQPFAFITRCVNIALALTTACASNSLVSFYAGD
jgi:hypothetical protein